MYKFVEVILRLKYNVKYGFLVIIRYFICYDGCMILVDDINSNKKSYRCGDYVMWILGIYVFEYYVVNGY